VQALDAELDLAAFSKKKKKWYPRKILFHAADIPADSLLFEYPDYDRISQALALYDEADEIEETGKLIAKYCKGKKIVANLAGGYLESCEAYVDEFVNVCVDERPTSPDSLYNLRMELKNHQRVNRREKTLHELKSIAKYQFGPNGDEFIPDNVKTKGMYHKRILSDGKQLALLNKDYGLYRLNLPGGEILKDLNINVVRIDFDLTTNTVFAPGIVEASHNIIPNDEVVVIRDDSVLGVGKAVMTGREMEECGNGIGVKIKHRVK
jgi:archaeosine synthase